MDSRPNQSIKHFNPATATRTAPLAPVENNDGSTEWWERAKLIAKAPGDAFAVEDDSGAENKTRLQAGRHCDDQSWQLPTPSLFHGRSSSKSRHSSTEP